MYKSAFLSMLHCLLFKDICCRKVIEHGIGACLVYCQSRMYWSASMIGVVLMSRSCWL